MLIDAHMHLWALARGDYDWLTKDLPALYRDFAYDDYAEATKDAQLTGCVLVQAAPTAAETDWLLAVAARHDGVRGVVGWIDLSLPVDPLRLAELRRKRLVGMRLMLQDWPDASLILSGTYAQGIDAIAASHLAIDALVRPHQLPIVASLAARHPGLTVIVDHGGKPTVRDGMWQPWADYIAALGALANVRCKLSGLVTEAEAGVTVEQLSPYVAHLAKCFGEDRLIWGSDWPLVGMRMSFAQWHAVAARLARDLALPADKLFGRNAYAAYRLETASHD